ncbi:MAG: iron ABC transporter [Firmicutes bacterium HGW-Firmicutes-1]|jgi:iron complex transport system permease protein|nr:MAG: iron ABC transporter [Firmicutes bacterium HGW-Firmicutes-1]
MKIRRDIKLAYKISIMLFILIVVTVGSIMFGTVSISIDDCIKIIGSHIPGLNQLIHADGIKESHIIIVMNLRLPRIILALFVGMGLSAAGCVYQGVFSNPMADPYLIGISSGAALGATIAMLFPISNRFLAFGSVSTFAFLGAITTMVFVFFIAKNKNSLPKIALILAGIAINYFIASLIALLMMFNKEKIESVYFWTLGSFRDASWLKLGFLGAIVIIAFIVIYKYYVELNMIMVNEEQALTLGVSTEKVKRILLVVASLMVAVIVSTCGIIGFVGLITPHATRLVVGANHKVLIPISTILGGIFMVVADTIARSILPNAEISVGIITALFGVPFFLALLYKNKKLIVQ